MLSKEDVLRMRKSPGLNYKSEEEFREMCDLALVGLSVQEVVENVPSALEFAKEFVAGTPKADFEEHKDQMMDDLRAEVRKRDTLIAAFALQQKGEVVSEFDSQILSIEGTNSGVLYGCPPLPLIVGQKVHVTITVPKPLEETR